MDLLGLRIYRPVLVKPQGKGAPRTVLAAHRAQYPLPSARHSRSRRQPLKTRCWQRSSGCFAEEAKGKKRLNKFWDNRNFAPHPRRVLKVYIITSKFHMYVAPALALRCVAWRSPDTGTNGV